MIWSKQGYKYKFPKQIGSNKNNQNFRTDRNKTYNWFNSLQYIHVDTPSVDWAQQTIRDKRQVAMEFTIGMILQGDNTFPLE